MNQHHDHSHQPDQPVSFWKSSGGIALVMLGLVVAFYLLREHWTHLGQRWPYLLLLLCPLMHVFMHGGHGHGHDHSGHNTQSKPPASKGDSSNT